LKDKKILVGAGSFSDAGVYRMRKDCALVQTADFFTPIVDDPFAYGQIAAANALSDVYAMGGRPITALNIVAMPTDRISPTVIREILRGGAEKVKEAGCALIGGHTIRNPEPIYGLAVTGVVDPRKMITNDAARAGDLLLLTKPLGTGIATTAIQRGLASKKLTQRVVAIMKQLNRVGAELAQKKLVRTVTDVTGFGLIGHLANICRASKAGAEIDSRDVPAIAEEIWQLIEAGCVPGGSRSNLDSADENVQWNQTSNAHKTLLTDAQTSGGLLLCVPPRNLVSVSRILRSNRTPSMTIIGRITSSRSKRCIEVT
jgi:selenide,water dikinase